MAKNCFLLYFLFFSVGGYAQTAVLHKYATRAEIERLPDSGMVRLSDIDKTLIFDIRYATEKNFTGKKIYPCPDVMLRKDAAFALKRAHDILKTKNLRMKIYDAYRPPSAQWKLWYHTPIKLYVTDPRKGSKHSMGIAIDLTLVDESGKELDMGTSYDFFGEASHHTYMSLPEKVLANRLLLKTTMENAGFISIKSEWWHYYYHKTYSIIEIPFDCSK